MVSYLLSQFCFVKAKKMSLNSLGIFPRVDGHNVPINDGHGSACGRSNKVAVHLEDGPLSNETFRQVGGRQLACGLDLLVPVPGLSRNVLFITKTSRKGFK